MSGSIEARLARTIAQALPSLGRLPPRAPRRILKSTVSLISPTTRLASPPS